MKDIFPDFSPEKHTRKIEGKFKESLGITWDYHALSEGGTNLPKGALIKKAAALLMQQETDLGFCDSHERRLFALAAANAMEKEESKSEVRALLRILKLISAVVPSNDSLPGTYSQKVARASKRGLRVGTRFDANPAPEYNEGGKEYEVLMKSITGHKDAEASQRLVDLFANLDSDSVLSVPRAKLGIKKDNEAPLAVIATSFTREEFRKKYNCNAFILRANDSSFLVFPKVPPNHSTQHEYVHSQEGKKIIFIDLREILMRGLNEISVELLTDEPLKYAYMNLKPLWDDIKIKIPNIEELVLAFKTSNEINFESALQNLYKTLISHLGLQGFLDLSRLMSSGFHEGHLKTTIRSILLPVSEVRKRLGFRSGPIDME